MTTANDQSDLDRRLRAEAALSESESRLHLLADSIPQLGCMANSDGWIFWYNKRWFDYTGTTLEQLEGWGQRKVHHPDHVDRVVARVQKSWETGDPWEYTFPLRRHDGVFRWFLSQALPLHDEHGEVVRWFGTNTDITEIREVEKRQSLLLDELNHRVKNMLSSMQSIAQMTLRGTTSLDEFVDKLNARLPALSRSHDLLARETWRGASLRDIIHDTLSAWPADRRVTIDGPEIRLGPTVAVTLGMAFHELATNAAKYGALSNDTGCVAVVWTVDWRAEPVPAVDLTWTETGGPAVQPAERCGLGTRLIASGLARELNADIKLDFDPAGLKCRMRLPLSNKLSATK